MSSIDYRTLSFEIFKKSKLFSQCHGSIKHRVVKFSETLPRKIILNLEMQKSILCFIFGITELG